MLRSGKRVAGSDEPHRNEGRWSSVVASGENLAQVDAALLLDLAAGQKLDLEATDGGLDIFRNTFEAEGSSKLVWSHEAGYLACELVDHVVTAGEGLKCDTDVLLVVELVLKSSSLVLAFSEELLSLIGWVHAHQVGQLSSSQQAAFQLSLEVGGEGQMLRIEVGRNKSDWDSFSQTDLHVIEAASEGLTLDLWEEVAGIVVTLGLDLRWGEDQALRKLGSDVVAEGLLGEVFQLVGSEILHAGREFFLRSGELEVGEV